MRPSPAAPPRAKNSATPLPAEPTSRADAPTGDAAHAPSFHPSAFNWKDADDAREWLACVRGACDDLATLALEGARSHKSQVLSRAYRRRLTREARKSLGDLLAQAEAGLPPRRMVP